MSLSSRLPRWLFSPRGARAMSRLREWLQPRKPRHPLARFALGLAGVSLLALLVVAGAIVGLAMLLLGMLARLLRLRGQPLAASTHGGVLEGHYRVLRGPAPRARAVPRAG